MNLLANGVEVNVPGLEEAVLATHVGEEAQDNYLKSLEIHFPEGELLGMAAGAVALAIVAIAAIRHQTTPKK